MVRKGLNLNNIDQKSNIDVIFIFPLVDIDILFVVAVTIACTMTIQDQLLYLYFFTDATQFGKRFGVLKNVFANKFGSFPS